MYTVTPIPESARATPRPRTRVLGSFVNFYRGRETFERDRTISPFWYVALASVGLGIGYVVAIVVSLVSVAISGEPVENAVADFVSEQPWWLVLILTVVVAPLWEETAFRLPVSFVPWTTAVGGSVLLVVGIPGILGVSSTWFVDDRVSPSVAMLIAGIELVAVGTIIYVGMRAWFLHRPPGPSVRHRVQHVAIIVLTITFALAHLTNYPELNALTPALVTPQLLLGAVIMFARVKGSWWIGAGLHAVNNLLAVSVALIAATSERMQVLAAMGLLGVVGLATVASGLALALNQLQSQPPPPALGEGEPPHWPHRYPPEPPYHPSRT